MTYVCPCQGVCSSVYCINIPANEVYPYTAGVGTGSTMQNEHISDLRSSINDEYARRGIAASTWAVNITQQSAFAYNEAVNELIISLNSKLAGTGIPQQLDGAYVNANVLLQLRNFIDYYRSLCVSNYCSSVTPCSCHGGYCSCVDNCTNVAY